MNTTFSTLGIRSELTDVLRQNGLVEATPVQEKTIPVLLAGKDVISQAQTGTGKTLAFVLPILEKINTDDSHVQALIITPTRELAIQITAEVKKLAPTVHAGVLAVYGGQDVDAQIHKLKRAMQIIVATPGRLLDHLRRNTIEFSHLSMLVLDEADQMLNMGFLTEIEDIISQTPRRRQTMLFSATMPDSVRILSKRYMQKPEDIQIRGKRTTLENIKQLVVETSDRAKQDALIQMIETYQPYLTVVFCRTKIRVKKLNEALIAHGFESDELHGDLSQAKREQVMKRFRDAKLQILVATDVAARGLDVEGVTHVFNYDIPQDVDSYIHRIGRTGRAGEKGVAVTFVAPKDRMELQQIEQGISNRLERVGGESNKQGRDPEEKYASRQNRSGNKSRGKSGNKPRGRSGDKTDSKSGGRSGSRAGSRTGGKTRSDNAKGKQQRESTNKFNTKRSDRSGVQSNKRSATSRGSKAVSGGRRGSRQK